MRLTLLLVLLYGFLVAIGLMDGAFKLLGEEHAGGLFQGVTNPFAGLAVGILATVLVQSSSVTTSTIVALCGSGQLQLELAVPMIMGANIGTTVTNTLVSVGSVRRSVEFRRAFACATVHDVFNFCSVAVLLPLELATGYLRHTAVWLADHLHHLGSGGGTFNSPIKVAVKAGSKAITGVLGGLGLEGGYLAAALLVLAIALIFACLMLITKNMRVLLVARIEAAMNEVLGRSGLLAIAVGIAITVAVQSSSITTSLLVPLCAAGVLRLENAYPITLGANIGTTVTAILASLAAEGSTGLAIALVHLLFNVSGTLLFFPIPALRRIPIRSARRLAVLAVENKFVLVAYLSAIFVLLPILGILVFR
ncbi:MAG: Na/Pi symporter [Planctomycetes bacterium]|nr:Na/Pi symporter [Planctomycetota bacterium]